MKKYLISLIIISFLCATSLFAQDDLWPPENLTATDDLTAVINLNWDPPIDSTAIELSYDDNEAEHYYYVDDPPLSTHHMAVGFTYPEDCWVHTGRFHISYDPGATDFDYNLFGGMAAGPDVSNVLASGTCTLDGDPNGDWYDIDLGGIAITGGEWFYLDVQYRDGMIVNTDCYYVGGDESDPDPYSWYTLDETNWFNLGFVDVMLRTVVSTISGKSVVLNPIPARLHSSTSIKQLANIPRLDDELLAKFIGKPYARPKTRIVRATFEHYNIYRDEAIIGTSDTEFYADSDIDNETWYEYYVTAQYVEGESDSTNHAMGYALGPLPIIEVGNAEIEDYQIPLNLWYQNSIVETVYDRDWIGFPMFIHQIGFHAANIIDVNDPFNLQVWMGEVDVDDLSAGWIDGTQLTQVYNGTIDVPLGSDYWLDIPLDAQFEYTQIDNLIIMLIRDDDEYFTMSDVWYTTESGASYCTLHKYSDTIEYDAMNPPDSPNEKSTYPDLRIYYYPYDTGNVDGTVTNADTGDPIEGAVVSIMDNSDVTGPDGTYLLEDIPIGLRDITCVADGYYDAADVVEVLEDQTVTVDFAMNPLIYGTLDGTVTDDSTGLPIEGAEINAVSIGDWEYDATTDEFGYYIIDEVVAGTYDVTCSADGYWTQTEEGVIIEAGLTTTVDFALILYTIPDSYFSDFEDDDGGLLSNNPSGWQWGAPTSGPMGAYSGVNVWATVLSGDYTPSANWTLETTEEILILSGAYMLEFWHWYDMEASYDGGNVKISTDGGATWTVIEPIGGYPGMANSSNPLYPEPIYCGHDQGFWEKAEFDLSAYSGQVVFFRWHFGSDSSVQYPGWYIDNVRVYEQEWGSLEGYVTELDGGTPIEGAEVIVGGQYTGYSDDTGYYLIEDIVAFTYDIICTADGYNDALEEDFEILPDIVNTLNFEMTAPTMDIDPLTIDEEIAPDDSFTTYITVSNDGDGTLDWRASIVAEGTARIQMPTTPIEMKDYKTVHSEHEFASFSEMVASVGFIPPQQRDFGDIIEQWSSPDGSPMGLDWDLDGNFIWHTSENAPSNCLYEIDIETHAIITSYPSPNPFGQAEPNLNGICVVGDYLYLTDFNGDLVVVDDYIMQVDKYDLTVIDTWEVDPTIDQVLGITYRDPYFYVVCNTASSIYEVDLQPGGTFNIISTIPSPTGTPLSGIHYLPYTSPPTFWMTSLSANSITETDGDFIVIASAGGPPGESVFGITWPGEGENFWLDGFGNAMMYIIDGDIDASVVTWIDVEPRTGTIESGNDFDVSVIFNSDGILPGTVLTADIIFTSDPDVGTETVDVTLTVGTDTLGSISGTVTLESLPPYCTGNVEDVVVTAGSYWTNPDDTGYYFMEAYPNIYNVTASLYGYEDSTIVDVVVLENQNTPDIDFYLNCMSGGLSGYVTDDSTGLPIEGATVIVLGAGPERDLSDVTDEFGYYEIIPIVEGTYDVTCSADGYFTQTEENVVIETGVTTDLDFSMVVYTIPDFYFSDFEDDDGGLVHGGTLDCWQWGTPTYGAPNAHSGVNVWATNLSGDFDNNANFYLETFEELVIASDAYLLEFWHWYDMGTGCYDGGNVKISTDGGSTWELLYPDGGYPCDELASSNPLYPEPGYGNQTVGWEQATFNLSAYSGQIVKFRWHIGTTSVVENPGWYIDDVRVYEQEWGSLEGYVTELDGDAPIEGAEITVGTQYAGTSGPDGYYLIEDIVAFTYDITCTADGYNDALEEDFEILPDIVNTLNFEMTAPTMNIEPLTITETVDMPGDSVVTYITVSNNGDGPLDWHASIQYPEDLTVNIPPCDGNYSRVERRLSSGLDLGRNSIPSLPHYNPTFELLRGSTAWFRGGEYSVYFYGTFDTDFPGDMTEILSPPAWAAYCGDYSTESDEYFYVNNPDDFNIYTVDAATGIATLVGPTGLGASLNGMACDKTDGTMYAVDGSNLYTIDLTTGAATLVGPIGNPGGFMINLACDGDGNLWGIDISSDDFWFIDKTTGAGTYIGLTGFDANFAQSMAWDPETDVIFWAAYGGGLDGNLRVVDRTTGTTAFVGDFEGGREVTVLAFLGRPETWLTVEPKSGTVPAGDFEEVEVKIKWIEEIAEGTILNADINFTSDPDVGEETVPVTATFGGVPPGSISGIVTLEDTDYSSGDVEDVVVTALSTSGGSYSTSPDDTGYYILDSVYVGTYDVSAILYGYEDSTIVGVVVDSLTNTPDIDFDLNCLFGALAGDVTDYDTGDPIVGATVTVLGAGPLRDLSGETDEFGHYEIVDIVEGVYDVEATHDAYISFTYEDVEILQDIENTQDFELQEVGLPPPRNLVASEDNPDGILVTWLPPSGGEIGSILLVDDDGSNAKSAALTKDGRQDRYTELLFYYTGALDGAGYTYDVYEVPYNGNGPDATTMSDYDCVIWFTGETWNSAYCVTISATDEANLAAYLDAGGKLILNAQDYFWDRYPGAGSFSPGQFPYDYLGVQSTTQDAWIDIDFNWIGGHVYGIDGTFTSGMDFDFFEVFSGSSGLCADELIHSGLDLLTTQNDPGIHTNAYNNAVFMTFELGGLVDGVSPSTTADLMAGMLDHLASSGKSLATKHNRDFLEMYNLYRSDSTGVPYDLVDTLITDTEYLDTDVALGEIWYYVATALYDTEDPYEESPYSNEDSGHLFDAVPPPPDSVWVSGVDDEVTISWFEVIVTENDIDYYKIYKKYMDFDFELIGTTPDTTYYYTLVDGQGLYYFYVITVDLIGQESEPSMTADYIYGTLPPMFFVTSGMDECVPMYVAPWGSAEEYTQAWHDGTFESQIGCGGGCGLGVRFTPVAYPTDLTHLEMTFQGDANCTAAIVSVYLDPDGFIQGPPAGPTGPGDPSAIWESGPMAFPPGTYQIDLSAAGVTIDAGDAYVIVWENLSGFLGLANDLQMNYIDRNWGYTSGVWSTIYDATGGSPTLTGNLGITSTFYGPAGKYLSGPNPEFVVGDSKYSDMLNRCIKVGKPVDNLLRTSISGVFEPVVSIGEIRDAVNIVISENNRELTRDLTGYIIYKSIDGGVVYDSLVYLDGGGPQDYDDYDVINDTTYWYYATAIYDLVNESDPSEIVDATPYDQVAPGPVTDLEYTVDVAALTVDFTWLDPVINEDGTPCEDLEGIEIYRDGVLLETVDPGVQAYTDVVPETGQYFYSFIAIDEVPNPSEPEERVVWVEYTLFAEDFSMGMMPPTDWSITGDFPNNWAISNTNDAGGEVPEGEFNWDEYGYVGTARLVTPVYNTTGMLLPDFEFKTYYHHYQNSVTIGVATTSDGGATWNTAWSMVLSGDYGPATVTFDITTPDVGSPNFQLCLFFSGDPLDIWYWHFDDIICPWESDINGNLAGEVTDLEFGFPIADAAVTIAGFTEYTSADGTYLIENIPVGDNYTVTCDASDQGYNIAYDYNVEITEDDTTYVDFELTKPELTVNPEDFEFIIESGQTAEDSLYLNNIGNGPVDFFIDIYYITDTRQTTILCVDRDFSNYFLPPEEYTDDWPYFQAALDTAGYTYTYYEVADPSLDGPDLATMQLYDVIIWFTGESWQNNQTMTVNDEINLAAYLDGGGTLFLSAQDYFWDLYPSAGPDNPFDPGQFPYDYLGMRTVTQDIWVITSPSTGSIEGVTGSLAEGITFDIQDIYTTDKDGLFIDMITVHEGQDLFNMTSPAPEGICGTQYDAGTFRTVFTTASFAAITDPVVQTDLIDDIIIYLTSGMPHWLKVEPMFGTIDSATIAELLVTADTEGLEVGEYDATITVNTENPDIGTFPIPVHLEVIEVGVDEIYIQSTKLHSNFPNPFSNSTTISFSLKEKSYVKLSVYNIKGQLVATLIDDMMNPVANYEILWNGMNGRKQLANGIYFYRFDTKEKSFIKKMLLLR